MLYPAASVLIWMLLLRATRSVTNGGRFRLDRFVVACLLMAGLTGLLYLPTAIQSGLAALVANPYVAPLSLSEAAAKLPGSLLAGWRQWNADLPGFVTVLLAAVWAASLLPRKEDGKPSAGVLGLVVLGVSVALALAQRVVPYERVWLFGLPLYQVGIAAGVERIAALPAPWTHVRSQEKLATARRGDGRRARVARVQGRVPPCASSIRPRSATPMRWPGF